MKFLRNYLNRIKPQFEEGGKLAKLHTSFEAFETFLFVPNKVTGSGVHIRDGLDLKRTMIIVVFALVPAILFGIWNLGDHHFDAIGEVVGFYDKCLYGLIKILPIIIVSYVAGLGVEFIFASIKKEPVNEGFLVTGMLIPLIVPVTIPLWMVAVATIFSVIIVKETFGGTGMNILNVALAARAFIFFAYPRVISGERVWTDMNLEQGQSLVDGFTGATPLAQAIENGTNVTSITGVDLSFMDMFLGFMPGSIGETSTLAILLGGVLLIATGIASWRIMLSVFVGGWIMGFVLNSFAVNPFMAIPPHFHLVMGGFAFGAVFMATDPVTAAQTNVGKYIYGLLIGIFAILIRVVNPAYPEGMMMAILLINVFAPLIDHYVVQANIKKRLKHA